MLHIFSKQESIHKFKETQNLNPSDKPKEKILDIDFAL